ncbi:MAG: hypothetical protein V4487_01545 [Chlamydiota bacterium]
MSAQTICSGTNKIKRYCNDTIIPNGVYPEILTTNKLGVNKLTTRYYYLSSPTKSKGTLITRGEISLVPPSNLSKKFTYSIGVAILAKKIKNQNGSVLLDAISRNKICVHPIQTDHPIQGFRNLDGTFDGL